MRSLPLALTLLTVVACKNGAPPAATAEPAAKPAEPAAEPAPAAEAPAAPFQVPADAVVLAEDATTGRLALSATTVAAGTPVTVYFLKTGINGCYAQTDVETTADGAAWTHTYTTSHEGEVCTAMIPMGGFTATVTPSAAGTWTGTVVVDGAPAGSYTIEATAAE